MNLMMEDSGWERMVDKFWMSHLRLSRSDVPLAEFECLARAASMFLWCRWLLVYAMPGWANQIG